MTHGATRRQFVAATAGLFASPLLAADADITVGITVDTRPDWNGARNFMRSIEEASAIGYHWIETFYNYVARWEDNPQELADILAKLNLKMETISNGGGMTVDFVDPARREETIASHMKLVQFIKALGCDHLKINCGRRPDAGHTMETYREMAKGFDELGKRISDQGIKFGIHHHLWSAYETAEDVKTIMGMTDPNHVYMILDTGHTNMAGMDPLALTKTYGNRIIEYHTKDCAPKDRGGYKGPPIEQGTVNTGPDDRIFFEMGAGGVDFPGIQAHLNSIGWKGWFTVELDRTATTAKDSATTSKKYIESVLKLKV